MYMVLLVVPIMLTARFAGNLAGIAACALTASWTGLLRPEHLDRGTLILLGLFAAYYLLMALVLRIRVKDLPLGWQVGTVGKESKETLWHNGGTGGFCSWAGIVRENGAAAVVLSNSANPVDELGGALMSIHCDHLEVFGPREPNESAAEASRTAAAPAAATDTGAGAES
jgi:CubicO group peptidase (beta-lactamase class C family)